MESLSSELAKPGFLIGRDQSHVQATCPGACPWLEDSLEFDFQMHHVLAGGAGTGHASLCVSQSHSVSLFVRGRYGTTEKYCWEAWKRWDHLSQRLAQRRGRLPSFLYSP